jgi:hypothetical protein
MNYRMSIQFVSSFRKDQAVSTYRFLYVTTQNGAASYCSTPKEAPHCTSWNSHCVRRAGFVRSYIEISDKFPSLSHSTGYTQSRLVHYKLHSQTSSWKIRSLKAANPTLTTYPPPPTPFSVFQISPFRKVSPPNFGSCKKILDFDGVKGKRKVVPVFN